MGDHDDSCLFCKISTRQEKSYIIWESDTHMAFLSIFPNTEGVTVVIPKSHYSSYAFDLDASALVALTLASQKVAKYLDENLPNTMRTAMVFEGFGVNHVHAKLFPMHGPHLSEWKPIKSNIKTKFNYYEGYISSHDSERAEDGDLKILQKILTKKFFENISLKQLRLVDAKQFSKIVRYNEINVYSDGFDFSSGYHASHNKAKKIIEKSLIEYNNKRSILFGIWQENNLMGIISLQEFDWHNGTAKINYYLNINFTNRGIMTIACKSLIRYSIVNLKLKKVFILVNNSNSKGLSVAHRLMLGDSKEYDKFVNGVSVKFVEFSASRSDNHLFQVEDSSYGVANIKIEDPVLYNNNSCNYYFTSAYQFFSLTPGALINKKSRKNQLHI